MSCRLSCEQRLDAAVWMTVGKIKQGKVLELE